jgi:hypothetical protein
VGATGSPSFLRIVGELGLKIGGRRVFLRITTVIPVEPRFF